MKDAFEVKGVWWLPDAKDNELPGTLSFSQEDGAILELVGVFGRKSKRLEQPVLIIGIAQNGKPITLYGCQARSWTHPLAGMGGAKYRVTFVFKGVHFQKESEIKFSKLCGSYTDLDSWVGISGLSIDNDISEDKFEVTIKYSRPDAHRIDLDENIEIGIGFTWQGPTETIVQTEAKISQQTLLWVKSKSEDLSFDELFHLLNKFSYLLQLGVQRIVYPVVIFGFTEANKQECGDEEPRFPEVNIYYQPIESFVERTPRIPQDMLFTFKDLTDNQIINWFSSYEKYQTAVQLHRSLFFSNRLFIDTRFLNITQALESLHSIRFENYYLPPEEFRRRKTLLLASAPEEIKEWTRELLDNANYKRFKVKILELLDKKTHLFSECITDNEHFATRVRDTRNEFVHHNPGKLTFRDNEQLVSAIFLLTYLFESYILEIVGFTDEKIAEIFTPRMKRYLSRWKRL